MSALTITLRRAFQAAAAASLFWCAAVAAEELLPPEKAFQAEVAVRDDRSLVLTLSAADGYHLYAEKVGVHAKGAQLAAIEVPRGTPKFDTTFNKEVELLQGSVSLPLRVLDAQGAFRLEVAYQGCSQSGVCYPPATRDYEVTLSGFPPPGLSIPSSVQPVSEQPGLGALMQALQPGSATRPVEVAPQPIQSVEPAADREPGAVLRAGEFWPVVGVFLLAGVLLSLTPCVLPMLPILSAILAGQAGPVSRARGLVLAVSYALGMSLAYTALGVAAGLAGEGLAAFLQHPVVLAGFAAVLVLMALSLFGAFELPGLGQGASRLAGRLPGGQLGPVFLMGAISAVVVSPCVAAPLAGALVYISHSGDAWLGGWALFALSWGMSLPLLALGASSGFLVPKAGPWMRGVKQFFGLTLIGLALYLLHPVLPAAAVLALWGLLLLAAAALVFTAHQKDERGSPWQAVRLMTFMALFCAGVLEMVGAASGGGNFLMPLEHLSPARQAQFVTEHPYEAPVFEPVATVAELDEALSTASGPVVLDVYADWCASCREMEETTFADPEVRSALLGARLLRMDVTANDAEHRAVMKRFGLYGPPALLTFDARGREVEHARVVGYQDAQTFLKSLRAAGITAP